MDGQSDRRVLARAQRRARLALVAAVLTALVLLAVVGDGGLVVLTTGLVGLALTGAGGWWALAHHGAQRVAGALLAVAAPIAVVAVYAAVGAWLPIVVAVALWAVALASARSGLRLVRPRSVHAHRTPPPRRPVLIMNPRSGGGKVARFGLVERAEKLGAQVVLLDPAVHTDVSELARRAVADGADLLGVAGGDGTQALVAAVAAEHDLPFLVISAGTRNHFAMDLGLDRTDPSTCLDALTDGEEVRVDLGTVAGLPFVNTVSFGAYAEIVQSPAYRDAKLGTALEALPNLLLSAPERRLYAQVDATRLEGQQAVLVSNNVYTGADPLAAGRRPRLNAGVLGVLGIRVEGATQAAEIALRGTRASGIRTLTAHEVVVGPGNGGGNGGNGGTPNGGQGGGGSSTPNGGNGGPGIAVAVDGEALRLTPPVVCRIRPQALRVRVPVHRPGAPESSLPLDWHRLVALVLGHPLPPARDHAAGPAPRR
ncbi:diacylglycerol/lipid kinase family protein [Kitasatospora sp. NPDC054939]